MITLARWDAADRGLLTMLNTPAMTAHLGGPETAAQLDERQERYLRTWDDRPGAMYRIDVDGDAAGGIGFWPVDEGGTPAFETGWSVLPEFQGQGVATAALRLLIAEVRRDGSRTLLMAYPAVDNVPSNALCARAGFEERGTGSEPWRGGILTSRRWALDMSPLDLTGRTPDVDERFVGDALATERWWPHYLPHWSSRERTAAGYRLGSGLELRVDAGTEPWAPEWDGAVRVSHLQSGQGAAEVGSDAGQHRFRDGLVVREAQEERRLWLPRFGVIAARMSAVRHPDALVAFWPIGFEDAPEESGEICIAEIFGSEMDDTGGWVGVGVKAQHDPRLRDDVEKVRIDGDLTLPHDYAVEWSPDRLRFFIDGRWVRTVAQRIHYAVQLMIDLYELPRQDGSRDVEALPHVARIERVCTFPEA
ncbi:GNAT family N-acetyltransferase [Microbacterium oleivorans]|uniref:GNAT family N-acetyltransferase n=1 Tax=Microbacterium oleivorans TaxID=273677 RepID=UPI00203E9D95|nr:GNAT family N-acetyltransferase [Microbacterium oleivorans]MCM3695148.1 GNAT family N-acetyltransferase [Microbacterium oleivorans]